MNCLFFYKKRIFFHFFNRINLSGGRKIDCSIPINSVVPSSCFLIFISYVCDKSLYFWKQFRTQTACALASSDLKFAASPTLIAVLYLFVAMKNAINSLLLVNTLTLSTLPAFFSQHTQQNSSVNTDILEYFGNLLEDQAVVTETGLGHEIWRAFLHKFQNNHEQFPLAVKTWFKQNVQNKQQASTRASCRSSNNPLKCAVSFLDLSKLHNYGCWCFFGDDQKHGQIRGRARLFLKFFKYFGVFLIFVVLIKHKLGK